MEAGIVAHDFPVNVFYTWVVQPTEEQFHKLLQGCPQLPGDWQRVSSLGVLMFLMRMLEKNLPLVRRVFLVTDGIVP